MGVLKSRGDPGNLSATSTTAHHVRVQVLPTVRTASRSSHLRAIAKQLTTNSTALRTRSVCKARLGCDRVRPVVCSVLSECASHISRRGVITNTPTVRGTDRFVSYTMPHEDKHGLTRPVDPSTSISFPTTLQVQSKLKFPPLTLIGVGVRTVSFLGIKVYSIGFYADLDNPNLHIPKDMPADRKIEHIVQNTSCVIRLVPTRTTNYTHLRDAFMRALQARMALARKQGTLSEEEAQAAGSPMRKLKSLFPNSPLEKHTPLDIYLTAPTPGRPRSLVFRDLGGVENDWVATELVLHYFEGAGPSPLLKQSVVNRLESFSK